MNAEINQVYNFTSYMNVEINRANSVTVDYRILGDNLKKIKTQDELKTIVNNFIAIVF